LAVLIVVFEQMYMVVWCFLVFGRPLMSACYSLLNFIGIYIFYRR